VKLKLKRTMHKRNLPHIYPQDAAFFITFRLKNSIPREVLAKMKEDEEQRIAEIRQSKLSEADKNEAIYTEKKRFFSRYDKALEKYATDDDFLKIPEIAQTVADKMHEYDKKLYDLIAYCIMSNHVHLLFTTHNYENADISYIMKLIKGGSAYLCNKILLNRAEIFWQDESYDHYIRNQKEFTNIEYYIIENPVKAGLIENWQQWKFTYWIENL
jgi:REP element-mobilizing transposase RayT